MSDKTYFLYRMQGARLFMDINSTSQPTFKRPEDENLGLAANVAYGFQHVLTMYGGIIAVPVIVGQAAGALYM